MLAENEATEKTWNFRDDNKQHYHAAIPLDQTIITLTLNWKASKGDKPRQVGRYRLNLPVLEQEGYVERTDRGWFLRFQRTGSLIEIAKNRNSKPLAVGKRPSS